MCADCEARRKMARDALLNARFSEALGHAVKGAAEIAGLKEKTGAADAAVLVTNAQHVVEPLAGTGNGVQIAPITAPYKQNVQPKRAKRG